MGHKVKIVAASFSHLRHKQPETIEPSLSWEEDIEGVIYHWIKAPPYSSNGFKRIMNMISFILKLWFQSKELATEYQPDIVICSSTYPLDVFRQKKLHKYLIRNWFTKFTTFGHLPQ